MEVPAQEVKETAEEKIEAEVNKVENHDIPIITPKFKTKVTLWQLVVIMLILIFGAWLIFVAKWECGKGTVHVESDPIDFNKEAAKAMEVK